MPATIWPQFLDVNLGASQRRARTALGFNFDIQLRSKHGSDHRRRKCLLARPLGAIENLRDCKEGKTFHKFPKCPELQQKWIAATRRENFTLSKFAVLYSCHFQEKDMDRTNCILTLINHMFQTDHLDNHLGLLIRAIAEKYLQIRYYYAGKQFITMLMEKRSKISRQRSTKLVIFFGL
ncbi:hypothetical protein CAPTEDRAFT_194474 [Capitella teleta]|uniref:THAP-type domain-containing protein n=1 Tax=Capitella teleta TaxID=283909 RepID=R7TDJ5_CAPTE|nr:hypothetical protein CAPTEDRAFT_194474 [Capitella teleta]|eukprot:ELT89136.1 hypothetical protein CAPTEDRAFT_194474 [Capitella teleta]